MKFVMHSYNCAYHRNFSCVTLPVSATVIPVCFRDLHNWPVGSSALLGYGYHGSWL